MTTYARISHVLTAVLSALVGVVSPGEVRRARPVRGAVVAAPGHVLGVDVPGVDVPGVDVPGVDVPGVDVPVQQRAPGPAVRPGRTAGDPSPVPLGSPAVPGSTTAGG
ncbi:hypothetical protein ACRAKJ_37945 [Saccharothrix sp. DSM 118769]